MTKINPYEYYALTHPVSIASRNLSRTWFLCYSKLLAMEWWVTDNPEIPYGATDGRRLILNESGIRSLMQGPRPVEMITFLLCHEALHALLNHPHRSKRLKCKRTANVAADYIINAMILKQGLPLMSDVLIDPVLSGDKSMEQLYQELLDERDQQENKMPDLVEIELAPDETEQQAVDSIEETNHAIIIADKANAKSSGRTATRVCDRGSSVNIRWQDVLWGFFTQNPRSRWCSPMNRPVYSSSGVVCLGREKRPRGVICVAVDTSGSITASMLGVFMAEIRDIIDQVKPSEVHILSVSHEVADHVVLHENDDIPVTLKGGGGTRFQPAFDYLQRNGITPDVMVYLTDGYSMDACHLKPIPYPVVWVTNGAANMNQGEIIKVA